MKLRVVCDTRFLVDQVEVDLELNLSELYPDSGGDIPPHMPYSKVGPVRITTFVDADSSHDLETSQFVTGVIMFPNKNLIQFHSRQHNTM